MATNVVFETDDIRSLTEKLGVDIDAELLGLALTHRSYAYEHGGIPHNERLEFLGDSILGQAVTVMLYTTLPDVDEGALAKRRASVVSTVALAEVARTIGLGAYLKLGRGEENTGGRDKDSLLADATEAIIGAAYLSSRRRGDDGFRAAAGRAAAGGSGSLRGRDGPEDQPAGTRLANGGGAAGVRDLIQRARPPEALHGDGDRRGCLGSG